MTVNKEVYYAKIITYLKQKKAKGEDVFRKDFDKFLKKTWGVNNPRYVVYRLKELGYIKEEVVIKLIKND